MNERSDRIEREVRLDAPPSRVWQALSDAREFGQWFGVDFKGAEFSPGARIEGNITHPGYEHVPFEIWVEEMERKRKFSWRWHPAAIDPDVDYSDEPTTKVEFRLKEVDGGTLVSVVETGFDQVPPERRQDAFRMNQRGWDAQMKHITNHLDPVS